MAIKGIFYVFVLASDLARSKKFNFSFSDPDGYPWFYSQSLHG